MSSRTEIIKKLLNSKFSLKEIFAKAIEHNCLTVIKYLVQIGNIPTIEELIEACKYGHLEIVKYFVKNGVDPTEDNNFTIITASNYGNFDVVKYLVSIGVDPATGDNQPIINACYEGEIEQLKNLLISAECSADIGSRHGKYYEIVKYLIKMGADWKYCSISYQNILKAEQTRKIYNRNKFRIISKNLIPVYYAPYFVGGILAKKDLESFCSKLNSV